MPIVVGAGKPGAATIRLGNARSQGYRGFCGGVFRERIHVQVWSRIKWHIIMGERGGDRVGVVDRGGRGSGRRFGTSNIDYLSNERTIEARP